MKKYEVTIDVKSTLTSRQLEELIADRLSDVPDCQVYRQITVSPLPEPTPLPAVNNPLSCKG